VNEAFRAWYRNLTSDSRIWLGVAAFGAGWGFGMYVVALVCLGGC